MPELIWEGKYNDNGQIIGPPRVSLPFQTVETVNQSAQERQLALTTACTRGNSEWRNRLIWGDKKYVLPSLLDEFAVKVNLIYIDPPFATGADFSYQAQVHPDHGAANSSVKINYEPNLIEQIAYRDTWGGGLDSYLKWMYETLTLLRELLAKSGAIYVHCDDTAGHYIKGILDEVFGQQFFRNDIIWRRATSHNDPSRFGRISDNILYYSKRDDPYWDGEAISTPKTAAELKTAYPSADAKGNFRSADLTGPRHNAERGSPSTQPWRNYDVYARNRVWAVPKTGKYAEYIERTFIPGFRGIDDLHERLDALDEAGLIHHPQNGFWPGLKRYADADAGNPPQNLILEPTGFTNYSSSGAEHLGFPTQKPEALVERIIKASSNEGDLVLDCFVGSGTTAAVAGKLGRRWIAADMGRFAISTTRKRLLDIPNVKPFYVQNLGRYERQAWQSVELEQDYREFILTLYHAEPVNGYQWLHGAKAGRMVHIGPVDAPVAIDDVQRILDEFGNAVGTGAGAPTTAGVDILGWDFGLEVDTEARELGQSAGVNIRLLRIPREVMDQKAVAAGDIRFFELAALSVEPKVNRRQRNVTLSLQDFAMPLDGVPEQVRAAVTHWSQWIDYWAIDWDYQNDTFNNQWQSYRTRQDPQLQRNIAHTYEGHGNYTVVVKVIDILGNDTTRRLEVEL